MTTDFCGHVRSRRARRRCLRGLDGQDLYTDYLLNISFDGTPPPICCIHVVDVDVKYRECQCNFDLSRQSAVWPLHAQTATDLSARSTGPIVTKFSQYG